MSSGGASRGAPVDVVVVSYRSAPTIAATISSVRSSELVRSIVVVDNASNDGSASVAAQAGANLVDANGNLGYAKAVNLGVRQGSAPLVLLLNPDAALETTCLASLCAALDDDAAVVAGPVLVTSDELVLGARRFSTWRNRLLGTLPGVRRLPAMSPEYDRRHDEIVRAGRGARPVDYVWGAAMLVERAFLEAVGGLDERFFMYHEDEDLCLEARRRGRRVLLVPTARVRHVGAFSSRGKPGLAEARLSFATAQLLEKWRAPWEGRLFLALRPAAFRLEWAAAMWHGDRSRAEAAERGRAYFERFVAAGRAR